MGFNPSPSAVSFNYEFFFKKENKAKRKHKRIEDARRIS